MEPLARALEAALFASEEPLEIGALAELLGGPAASEVREGLDSLVDDYRIRGVQTSPGTLDVLMEANWIRIAGRREAPGRPTIYATTDGFLDHFGLSSRRDLPGVAELRAAGLLDRADDNPNENEDGIASDAGGAFADEGGN